MITMATSELSADTRVRILETAWERVREGGTGAVSVKGIAAAAGVSRQLVYFHYGSRAGLLTAMARHRDEASGFRRRVAATRELPPAEGVEALLREWCAYLPALMPVARALEAASITGDEGGGAWRDRMGDLQEAFRLAIDRLAKDGGLADGWSVAAAADWITARTQPSTYAHLVEERGWSPKEYTRRTTASVLGELLAS
jgi:AcrR family transcriptional regulator